MMSWLRRKVWMWLGLDQLHRNIVKVEQSTACNQQELDEIWKSMEPEPTLQARLKAAENSCRKLEERCRLLEGISLREGVTLGILAKEQEKARLEAEVDRYARSAAEARGIGLEAYLADLKDRRDAKEAQKGTPREPDAVHQGVYVDALGTSGLPKANGAIKKDRRA